jgi:hypothetical protein
MSTKVSGQSSTSPQYHEAILWAVAADDSARAWEITRKLKAKLYSLTIVMRLLVKKKYISYKLQVYLLSLERALKRSLVRHYGSQA